LLRSDILLLDILCSAKLVVSGTPEIDEVLFLLLLGLLFLPPLVDLVLSGLFYRVFELDSLGLGLLEELPSLFFCLCHLLVQDLIFPVL